MFEALKIHIDAEHRLAICRPEGLLDAKLARQLMLFLMALEEFRWEPINRLLDLTAIDQVWLTSRQLFDISGARRAAAANLSHFRTAIIAPEPLAFGMARMYETLMHRSNNEVSVFWEPASAAAWLGVPEKAVQPDILAQQELSTERLSFRPQPFRHETQRKARLRLYPRLRVSTARRPPAGAKL
jgi:hypothetical protein